MLCPSNITDQKGLNYIPLVREGPHSVSTYIGGSFEEDLPDIRIE